jgi:hypothetical protein
MNGRKGKRRQRYRNAIGTIVPFLGGKEIPAGGGAPKEAGAGDKIF